MKTISITMAAFAVLVIGSSTAFAMQSVTPGRGGGPDGTINESCMYNCTPIGEIPDPEPDPDPIPGNGGLDNLQVRLTCDVRDDGLVFRNVGDITLKARTRLAWSTSDGQSGRVQLAVPMGPRTSVLHAGVHTVQKANCVVSPV